MDKKIKIKYYEPIINAFDYQGRIYKNEPNRITWGNKVHEKITGYKHFSTLPDNPVFSINHTKTIEKQELQNDYYNQIEIKKIN